MQLKLAKIAAFLSIFLLHVQLQASSISGFARGRLTLQNSPYTVTADLKIAAGDTLSIDPGVVLMFNTSTGFTISGNLQAIGTETDSIFFISNNATPNPGDWTGLYFSAGASGRLEFCDLKHAGVGVTMDASAPDILRSHFTANNTGLDCLAGAGGSIEESLFKLNPNAGIRVLNAAPVIKKCILQQNSDNGLESAIVLQGAGGIIVQNLILENVNSGIDLTNSSAVNIYHNTIVNNDMGITISDCNPTIYNNIIAMNGTGISTENSIPAAFYNAVALNNGGNFITPPSGLGTMTRLNTRGDSCDAYFNIQLDPVFFNPAGEDFRIQIGSPCIDTGDPANPAGIWIAGAAPDIGAHENNGVIVPVELVSFTILHNELQWTTATESNNLGFYIETATKRGGHFSQIGFVAGAGTTVEPQFYAYKIDPVASQQFYRLKQVDFDGSSSYSQTIKLESPIIAAVLRQNFPNPFSAGQKTIFEFRLAEQSRIKLTVVNLLGQQIRVLTAQTYPPGVHSIEWDGRDEHGKQVSAGQYFYILKSEQQVISKILTMVN